MTTKTKKRRSPHGTSKKRDGSGDNTRGGWCTPENVARAVGHFDVDPFTNERSHIDADAECILERGDNGFGDGTPGSYFVNGIGLQRATEATRVWLQPDYAFVNEAFAHYRHARWTALLRFDPRVTSWFRAIYRASGLVVVLRKCEFEPPPGVETSSNPTIHALYYRSADDVTDAVLRLGYAWRPR